MAYTGHIIENPVSGERITFRETAADTGGEYLEIELALTPDGRAPGMHVHPEQEERFEVTEGRMRFRMGAKTIVAEVGDVVTVPAGKAHRFANARDGVTKAIVRVTPALEMERLFETTVQLAEEGRTNGKGMPRPLDLALFVREFGREVRGPFAPGALQRATFAPLAWLAHRRGHAERYRPRRLAVA